MSRVTRVNNDGFGLIAVFVGLFFFSVSLLGLQRALIFSLRYTQDAYMTSLAYAHVANLAEQIYFQRTLPVSAIAEWKRAINHSLPVSEADIQPYAQGYQVNIVWLNRSLSVEEESLATIQVYL